VQRRSFLCLIARCRSASDRAGKPLSWTSERTDMLFVRERERKAAAQGAILASGASIRVCASRSRLRMTAMVTAIVFVKAEVARIPEVAEEIAALSGVSEVYSVTGTIDLIAMIRVSNHDQVAEVVADRLNKVPGVVSTETHIAFRAYSAHDLEAAFSLGG
jgi:DNA-binding Lrp family transcriptional regulator